MHCTHSTCMVIAVLVLLAVSIDYVSTWAKFLQKTLDPLRIKVSYASGTFQGERAQLVLVFFGAQREFTVFIFSFSFYPPWPEVVRGISHCLVKGTHHPVWELFKRTNIKSLFMFLVFAPVFVLRLSPALLFLSHLSVSFSVALMQICPHVNVNWIFNF